MKHTLTQEQELIQYSNSIGFRSLPNIISNHISTIRKTFANTITADINKPYTKQVEDLLKACKENNIEFVNSEVFGSMDDTGILRIEETLNNPTTNTPIVLTIDVFISPMLHDDNEEDTKENTFLVCPYYADITISDTEKQEDVTIQDINSNTLACMLKGENVQLQINTVTLPETTKTFVTDGCHKLYTIPSEVEREHAKELEYIVAGSNKDNEIEHAISELEQYYLNSCPLRFISTFGIGTNESIKTILPQFTDSPMFIYY